MTPAQFYGWYEDHEFLHEPRAPRRDTWLAKKLREKEMNEQDGLKESEEI